MESEPVSTLTHSSHGSQKHGELTLEDEWQAKLSSLQDQHKHESLQQQQEHLEQLRHLQTQLLRELSSDMSMKGDLSIQDLVKSRQLDSKEPPSPQGEQSTEKDISVFPTSVSNTQGVFTPTQSFESLSLPRNRTVVKHSPVQSPEKPRTPRDSPDKQPSVQTPVYKILGPKSAWEGGSLNHSPSKSSMSATPQSTARGETQSRVSLVAKHTKHVEDLKKYYETEILSLRRQLEQVRPGARACSPLRGSGSSSPAQRQLKFSTLEAPSPAQDHVVQSELWILQSENERLKTTYTELQRRLDEMEREKHVLEGQLKRLQQHVAEWQERCESSERMGGVLQERLDTSRSHLHEQERLNGQLTSDLKMTIDELLFWKDQKLQDVDKLDQLFHEFEVLQEENQQLLSANSDLKAQLEESGGECVTLRSSLDKYQVLEAQYQSTIRRLEEEVRHLEHVNNRLHSQVTHYDTGWPTEPAVKHHGHVTRSPQPDRSRNTPHHSQSTKPNKSPVPLTETHHTLNKSPVQTPQSVNRPLTRKKWLESSVPGLLFGGPDTEEKLPPSQSRLPSRMSPETNVPRAAKQSPRGGSRDTDERTPARFNPNEYSVDSTLKAVRDGSVVTGREGKRKSKKKSDQSLEDRVREGLERVSEAEKRLVELQTEKERLESALQRTPRPGGRVTKEMKQNKLDLEGRLEQVVKEIGSVRMILRKHHAFKR